MTTAVVVAVASVTVTKVVGMASATKAEAVATATKVVAAVASATETKAVGMDEMTAAVGVLAAMRGVGISKNEVMTAVDSAKAVAETVMEETLQCNVADETMAVPVAAFEMKDEVVAVASAIVTMAAAMAMKAAEMDAMTAALEALAVMRGVEDFKTEVVPAAASRAVWRLVETSADRQLQVRRKTDDGHQLAETISSRQRIRIPTSARPSGQSLQPWLPQLQQHLLRRE